MAAEARDGALAFQDLDIRRFQERLDAVRAELGCLSQAPTEAQVLDLYVLLTLDVGRTGDDRGFRAALAASPSWSPGEALIAPGTT